MSSMHKQSMLYELLRIRMIEEAIAARYSEQQMRCPTHFSIGQEAVAVGVCANLTKEDYVMSTHRPHAHYLAKGGSLKRFIAELYGKETGCAGGRGGSMHVIDLSAGFLGCVPIVGSTIPIAVGAAFGAKKQNKNNVTVVFFGDGATEEGVFYESLNFAKLHGLPILFVCENNLYSVNTPYVHRRDKDQKIIDLAKAFQIETAFAEGQDCDQVYDLTNKLIHKIKNNKQPAFLELTTYLRIEHCGPNWDDNSRPKEERELWFKKDPVEIYRHKLKDEISEEAFLKLRGRIEKEIEEAFEFAHDSKFPTRKDLMKNIFSSKQEGAK